MTTQLVKPSKLVRNATSIATQTLTAVDRAGDIYKAQLNRAQSEYLDRIKRIVAAGDPAEDGQKLDAVNGADEHAPPPAS